MAEVIVAKKYEWQVYLIKSKSGEIVKIVSSVRKAFEEVLKAGGPKEASFVQMSVK